MNNEIIIAVNANDAQLFFDFAKEVPDSMIAVEKWAVIGVAELQEFIINITPHLLTLLTAYLVTRIQISKKEIKIKKGDIEIEIKGPGLTTDEVLSVLKQLEK